MERGARARGDQAERSKRGQQNSDEGAPSPHRSVLRARPLLGFTGATALVLLLLALLLLGGVGAGLLLLVLLALLLGRRGRTWRLGRRYGVAPWTTRAD